MATKKYQNVNMNILGMKKASLAALILFEEFEWRWHVKDRKPVEPYIPTRRDIENTYIDLATTAIDFAIDKGRGQASTGRLVVIADKDEEGIIDLQYYIET